MRRFFLIPVMWCVCVVALAQPLYKWLENDGSITFSPQPPTDGRQYERVDTGVTREQPTSAPSAGDSTGTRSITGREPVDEKYPDNLPSADLTGRRNVPAAADMPTGAALPATDSDASEASVTPTIERADQAGIVQRQTRSDTEGIKQMPVVLSRKDRQCRDLQKRVISLEHRLRSSLNAEDMDNTVVHMARYQRSIDQYCGQ